MNLARVFSGVFILIVLVAFNNCSGGFHAENSIAVLNSTTSQCRLQTIHQAKTSPLSDPSVCEKEAHYRCDFRSFRPQRRPAEIREIQCLTLHEREDFCVPVVTFNYDTSAQSLVAEPEDLMEGGAYNRDEVSCYNTEVKVKDIAVIQGEGDTLLEALEKSIGSCLRRTGL